MEYTARKEVVTRYIVDATAYIFVVPNRASFASELSSPSNDAAFAAKKLAECNKVPYDPIRDRLVQLWWVSPDLNSHNLVDEGFRIDVDGDELDIRPYQLFDMEWVPHTLIDDLSEDGSKVIVVPVKISNSAEMELHLTVVASQTVYRYKHFGNFEDVVKRVMGVK